MMVSISRPRHTSRFMPVNKRTILQLCKQVLAFSDFPFYRGEVQAHGLEELSVSGVLPVWMSSRTAAPCPRRSVQTHTVWLFGSNWKIQSGYSSKRLCLMKAHILKRH